jgi:hypothetical protein
MDEELRRVVRERAYMLWEADGRPDGRDLEYWTRAEDELASQSDAGEEDPLAGIEGLEPGTARGTPSAG